MTSHDTETRAEDARKRGNDLYKRGKLEAAEVEYKNAAELAPHDPAPLSNLSSVKFELGEYTASIQYILKSLELTNHAEGDEAGLRKEKTLYERLAKCYMHASRFDEAGKIVDEISDRTVRDSIHRTLDTVTLWPSPGSDAIKDHRQMVFDRIPRYQASLEDIPEYYAIGHDSAETLFDTALERSCSSKDSVSLMFCGSGDARNLFTTILFLAAEEMGGRKMCKDIHITILDLKPAAIARTLIFFDMMTAYSIMKFKKVPGIEDAPIVLAYLFTGHVIPAAVNEKLQTHIMALVEALETGEEIYDWLFLPEVTRKGVLRVLKQWQNPIEANYYRAPTVRVTVRSRMKMERMKSLAFHGKPKNLPGFEKDKKSFEELAILLPSEGFAKRRDPPLVELMKNYHGGSKGAATELAKHIDATWVTNLTLIDYDHVESLCKGSMRWSGDEDKVPAIETDPLELAGRLPPIGRGTGVLEVVGEFFDITALGVLRLCSNKRLMIEALVGEMTDTMERLRWGCLDGRGQPSEGIDPSKFPRTFDRIHMSNIPDYIGGFFSAAMYGRLLLREDKPSNLQFTVLLNSPMFSTHEDFQAEYALMHDKKRLTDHFSLIRIPGPASDGAFDDVKKQELMKSMGVNGDFMFEGYLVWEKCPAKKLSRGKDMLARPALEKWIYAHFLKIWLPYPRARRTDRPVQSPLNLTALLRLMCHLVEIGYPAHWLSGILSALCGNGNITTTARPPKGIVTSPADVDATFPALQMTVSPWRTEFTTVLSIWAPLMPFGFIVPPGALMSPADIGEFSVGFPDFQEKQTRMPHFVLVFWDSVIGDPTPTTGLRRLLLDDEGGDTSPAAIKRKREGIHVVTTMKYTTDTRTASFWCRTDIMQLMRDGEWEVSIWRVDVWERVTDSVVVKDAMKMERLWNQ